MLNNAIIVVFCSRFSASPTTAVEMYHYRLLSAIAKIANLMHSRIEKTIKDTDTCDGQDIRLHATSDETSGFQNMLYSLPTNTTQPAQSPRLQTICKRTSKAIFVTDLLTNAACCLLTASISIDTTKVSNVTGTVYYPRPPPSHAEQSKLDRGDDLFRLEDIKNVVA